MRARILGVVMAALLAPLAYAGDITPQGKIAAPQAAAEDSHSWNRSGFYVGILGAYDVTALKTDGINFADGSLMAGAMGGYNWRVSQAFMLGLEGDWMFTGVSATHTDNDISIKASTNSLLSLRLRAGVPIGPALLYVTGGAAWQNTRLTVDNEISDRTWQLGGVFGGGAEVELTRTVALRLEALHYIFPADGAPLSQFLDSQNQQTTIRAGFAIKLN